MTTAPEPDAAPGMAAASSSPAEVPSFEDDETVLLTLPASPEAVGRARRVVGERWSWLDDEVLGDVELVVAELVSNAVKHGRPEIEVRLRVEPFAVDVAVLDHGDGDIPTEATLVDRNASSGRGLAIIDRLSSFWGVDPLPDGAGKTVWASLSRK